MNNSKKSVDWLHVIVLVCVNKSDELQHEWEIQFVARTVMIRLLRQIRMKLLVHRRMWTVMHKKQSVA